MNPFTYIIESGSEEIYNNPLVTKPEITSNTIDKPVHEDIRGKIERKNINGSKFTIIETKKGFMRGGDLHKNTQFNLIISGKVEIQSLVNDTTQSLVVGPNSYIISKPNTPQLFNFLEDTVMIEWWDGDFDVWFYKPYRDKIEEIFKNNKLA